MLAAGATDRMAALGVTASVQPAFLASEVEWLPKRLGPRVDRTYSFRAMAEAGVPMVGGSDCPVEAPNPWEGIAAAAGPGRPGPTECHRTFQPLPDRRRWKPTSW